MEGFNLSELFAGINAFTNQQNANANVKTDNSMLYGVVGLALGMLLCKVIK